MVSLSDNVAHIIQLTLILATMCILILFAPTVPSEVVLAAFVPTATALIGAKISQSATNAANAPDQPPQITSLHAPAPITTVVEPPTVAQ